VSCHMLMYSGLVMAPVFSVSAVVDFSRDPFLSYGKRNFTAFSMIQNQCLASIVGFALLHSEQANLRAKTD